MEGASHPLPVGTEVAIDGLAVARVERRAGTDERPLVRLTGTGDREGASGLRGAALAVAVEEAPLAEDEWLSSDLVGCRIEGLGVVRRVVAGPSCDLLELGSGELVPFVADAVRRVDVAGRVIEVDHGFLGFAGDGPEAAEGAS